MVTRGELPAREKGLQAKVRQARHAGLLPVCADILGRGGTARRIARIGWIVQVEPTGQSPYTRAARYSFRDPHATGEVSWLTSSTAFGSSIRCTSASTRTPPAADCTSSVRACSC